MKRNILKGEGEKRNFTMEEKPLENKVFIFIVKILPQQNVAARSDSEERSCYQEHHSDATRLVLIDLSFFLWDVLDVCCLLILVQFDFTPHPQMRRGWIPLQR